jgi:hypothetical protein
MNQNDKTEFDRLVSNLRESFATLKQEELDEIINEGVKFVRSNNPNQTTIDSFNEIKQGKFVTTSLDEFKKSLKEDEPRR